MIRQQRELAALPMRQLAAMSGISGPYLSQIENGLRAPSEQVLRSIAKTLGVPAEDLLGESDGGEDEAEEALRSMREVVRADPTLTAGQRRALLEVYRSMVAATQAEQQGGSAG
ncbi:MAG: helix-turn-helix transcriptional regulator [Actinomycetales bacterium]|nr:helix-turn-helix transcriptional regulator [Actinomycetales bacterium]